MVWDVMSQWKLEVVLLRSLDFWKLLIFQFFFLLILCPSACTALGFNSSFFSLVPPTCLRFLRWKINCEVNEWWENEMRVGEFVCFFRLLLYCFCLLLFFSTFLFFSPRDKSQKVVTSQSCHFSLTRKL